MSQEYEACSYASTSAIPDDGTPITKSVSVCRRQRVPKRAASLTRGKSVEVLPRVSEEEEPSTCNATEDDAEDADEPPSGSAWSSDEDERPALTRSSSFTKGLLKRLRKHRPRPLGIIADRGSIIDDWVISPAAVLDESSDDEVVIAFPQPPRTPSTPKKPVLKLELPKDVVVSQHGAQSPTPSNASSASPVSTAPNTPGGSDNERELVSPVDSILSSRNKPLPPPPAIHPYDRRVETAVDQDDLWERRINEIFSLLAGDDSLADTSDNDESSVQRFPTGPAVRTVDPISPISSSSIASSRRRRSYVSTAPKRPPPPVPESVTSDSPLSVFSPTESEFLFPLPELSPRPRPALPRSPIPADIPVDVRASMATTVSGSSYSEGSFFDAYQALQTADLHSRFSTSTFASSRFTATSPTDGLYIRKRKSSKSSANTRAAREALRKRNARHVEAPMSPTSPSTIATPLSF